MAPSRYLIAFLIFVTGCSGAKKAADNLPVISSEKIVQIIEDKDETPEFPFDQYRSRLSDAFNSFENNIPDAYLTDTTNTTSRILTNNGFRIQIISTTNLAAAQQAQSNFQEWITGQHPERMIHSYLIFRQPHYRVHVGDFRSRAIATEYSNQIKRRFSDAWVVYDQINTDRVIN